MTKEDLALLYALDGLIKIAPNLVSDLQYNIYNGLTDKADELNILW